LGLLPIIDLSTKSFLLALYANQVRSVGGASIFVSDTSEKRRWNFPWAGTAHRPHFWNTDRDDFGTMTAVTVLRLASASPAEIRNSTGTAWHRWDITSGLLGFGTNWLDYPDLSVGNQFLWLTVNKLESVRW
jgi:hypothetical protein